MAAHGKDEPRILKKGTYVYCHKDRVGRIHDVDGSSVLVRYPRCCRTEAWTHSENIDAIPRRLGVTLCAILLTLDFANETMLRLHQCVVVIKQLHDNVRRDIPVVRKNVALSLIAVVVSIVIWVINWSG